MTQNTWEKLEVPTLMLVSLVIQALLAFLAPLRKSSANGFLLKFLWLLYLCADSVALLVIGLISRSHQSDDNDSRADILAFWAPFLLLHLGGPDTITALALEDNELWHRHALQLVSQTAVTIYVFVLSMTRGRHNRLWLPMALMFIDGFIKYAERTCALYLASKEGIRANLGEEPITSINKWADEYYSAETSYIPSRFEVAYVGDSNQNEAATTDEEIVDCASDHNEATADAEIVNGVLDHNEINAEESVNRDNEANTDGSVLDHNEINTEESVNRDIEANTDGSVNRTNINRDDSVHNEANSDHDKSSYNVEDIVNYAYKLYDNFKGMLADDVLNLKDDEKLVEQLFVKQYVLISIKIITAELNLIYDILHTKVYLINKKRGLLRLVCFFSLIAASLLFFLAIHRSNKNYKRVDVGVSFTLLGGAIFLDIVSFFRFLHSDWFIIKVTNLMMDNSYVGKPFTLPNYVKPLLRKWSYYLPLIVNELLRICSFTFQLRKCLLVLLNLLLNWSTRCRDNDAKRWCLSTSNYNLLSCSFRSKALDKLLDLIYIKRIKDCLIDWLYVKRSPIKLYYLEFIFTELQQKAKLVRGDIKGMEEVCSARGNLVFEEEYCLVSEYLRPWTTDVEDYSESVLTWHLATDICYWIESDTCEPRCKLSKQLSDYMVYILLRRQDLVPQLVSKSDVQYKSTVKDVTTAFDKASKITPDLMQNFCNYVVHEKLDDRIAAQVSKSNDSQSVFDEACCLAKQLMMFGDNKWEIISKVWVEMLCYAAIRSSPRYNFASLSKGGELITLVWLFMSHLGFRLPLPKKKGLRSAKLIIDK